MAASISLLHNVPYLLLVYLPSVEGGSRLSDLSMIPRCARICYKITVVNACTRRLADEYVNPSTWADLLMPQRIGRLPTALRLIVYTVGNQVWIKATVGLGSTLQV